MTITSKIPSALAGEYPPPELFLEVPDVQDESGIATYYSRELVLECIDSALAARAAAHQGDGGVEPSDVVYRWRALDNSGFCYGSTPPDDLPQSACLTAFYRQPERFHAALHEISATGNLTATPAQFARHLQSVARDALSAQGQEAQLDQAVEKAWGRFEAAMDKGIGLPPPGIHAAAHYAAFLRREAHKQAEPTKAGAIANAATMIDLLVRETRRLHRELIDAQATTEDSSAAQADADKRDATRYRHLRACNSGSLVIVKIIGTEDDDQIVLTEVDADTEIDTEIAALSRKGGEAPVPTGSWSLWRRRRAMTTDTQDAARYRCLREAAKEQLLNPKGAANEYAPDMRTHWVLPVLMCSGPTGGYRTFDEAVDSLIEEKAGQ
ncbi:MAG: hypothetical protein QM586_11665 [Xenophilus sp.]